MFLFLNYRAFLTKIKKSSLLIVHERMVKIHFERGRFDIQESKFLQNSAKANLGQKLLEQSRKKCNQLYTESENGPGSRTLLGRDTDG